METHLKDAFNKKEVFQKNPTLFMLEYKSQDKKQFNILLKLIISRWYLIRDSIRINRFDQNTSQNTLSPIEGLHSF